MKKLSLVLIIALMASMFCVGCGDSGFSSAVQDGVSDLKQDIETVKGNKSYEDAKLDAAEEHDVEGGLERSKDKITDFWGE